MLQREEAELFFHVASSACLAVSTRFGHTRDIVQSLKLISADRQTCQWVCHGFFIRDICNDVLTLWEFSYCRYIRCRNSSQIGGLERSSFIVNSPLLCVNLAGCFEVEPHLYFCQTIATRLSAAIPLPATYDSAPSWDKHGRGCVGVLADVPIHMEVHAE